MLMKLILSRCSWKSIHIQHSTQISNEMSRNKKNTQKTRIKIYASTCACVHFCEQKKILVADNRTAYTSSLKRTQIIWKERNDERKKKNASHVHIEMPEVLLYLSSSIVLLLFLNAIGGAETRMGNCTSILNMFKCSYIACVYRPTHALCVRTYVMHCSVGN